MGMVPPTRSGDRKLSEVARHLVLPEGIVSTGWPQVAAQLAKMQYPMDGWQRGFGTVLLGKRETGLYACGIGGAVVSIPRQVGKTHVMAGLVFALCAANPGMLVLWTAHRARTHNETFQSMQGVAMRSSVAPYVANVRRGSGQEAVEFVNGSRILFGARESGFGRGFAKVDILVLDEAQILSERAMEDMVPATNASPNGLVLMMGTPPRPNDPGDVFTARRADALAGDPDVLYVEMSADEDADPDDRAQWRIANPSYPHRTTEAAFLRMRKLLGSVDSFKREGLGIWDKRADGSAAFDFAVWRGLAAEPPVDGTRVFGVKFSADGSGVALGACVRPEAGEPFVEGIASRSMGEGTQWLVDFLVERKDRTAQIVIDGRAGVGFLVDALRAEGVGRRVILTPTVDEAITAHTMFDQAVTAGALAHAGNPGLDGQVQGATRRKIGTSGAFGWAPRDPDGSVGLLDAVTLAHWGARTTKRKPGRRQRFG